MLPLVANYLLAYGCITQRHNIVAVKASTVDILCTYEDTGIDAIGGTSHQGRCVANHGWSPTHPWPHRATHATRFRRLLEAFSYTSMQISTGVCNDGVTRVTERVTKIVEVPDVCLVPLAAHPADGLVHCSACGLWSHLANSYVMPCMGVNAISAKVNPCIEHPTGLRNKCPIGRAAISVGGRKDPVRVEAVGCSIVHAVGSSQQDIVT